VKNRQEIGDKADEILNFIKAVLTPDLVLPHFIHALGQLTHEGNSG
jgi:hypothetical protein